MEAIIRKYSRDKNFGNLYRNMLQRLRNSPRAERITTFESFRLDANTKWLFFRKDGSSEKLYIPDKFVRTLLKMGHDVKAHLGANGTRDYLREYVFIPRPNPPTPKQDINGTLPNIQRS
jgi:hypothetical protein